ncbi:hypothetical protein KOI35_08990 [Actinoplanes bogorensis]|uniref:Uncharacterized protein n=1 Tax=Paractinoplanes bogorensis TaxID=1610840 RepID=A0ABS5YJI9_9ACTN|nr:hypothetical protein [Actinoplanes bogorensis]MBU2663640.1 hypothetical protein [Actinoplanes bogorensis]
MITGAVIVESLRPGAVLDDSLIRVRRLSRFEVDDGSPEQPLLWTLVEFSSDADPDDLAELFADALTGRGWYVSFETGDETYVIFPGRVLHYPTGDRRARADVEVYALSVGVPDNQLDW